MGDIYKAIPGFTKYEINDEGIVRNVKTKRTTEPYHVSQKTGPLVHFIDKKAGKNERLSVLRLVWDLFGTKVPGWDVDHSAIEQHGAVVHKDRDANGEIIKAPKKVKEPKVKAPKEPKAKKDASVKVPKTTVEVKAAEPEPAVEEAPAEAEPLEIF